MSKLNVTEVEILKILIDHVNKHKRGEWLSYKELAEKVGKISVVPHNLGLYLGRVSQFCMDNGAPPISVVVGNIEDGEPGAGFFELITGRKIKKEDRMTIRVNKVEEVYDCEDWQDILTKI